MVLSNGKDILAAQDGLNVIAVQDARQNEGVLILWVDANEIAGDGPEFWDRLGDEPHPVFGRNCSAPLYFNWTRASDSPNSVNSSSSMSRCR